MAIYPWNFTTCLTSFGRMEKKLYKEHIVHWGALTFLKLWTTSSRLLTPSQGGSCRFAAELSFYHRSSNCTQIQRMRTLISYLAVCNKPHLGNQAVLYGLVGHLAWHSFRTFSIRSKQSRVQMDFTSALLLCHRWLSWAKNMRQLKIEILTV